MSYMLDGFECNVCLEVYEASGSNVPMLLDCGHTFCFSCISSFIISSNLTINCPMCNRKTKLKKNINDLKKIMH